MHTMKRLPIVLLVIGVSACDKTYFVNPTIPSQVGTVPTGYNPNTPVPATGHKIEFRVNGNALTARIRYSNPIDGLTQVVTTLPYSIILSTNQPTMFISLEATPFGYPLGLDFPFLSAQIFVNGFLFREATSSNFTTDTISVSGTWRQ